MFKITGLHPGGGLYRALPFRHRVGAGICRVYAGLYSIDAGMYLSLSLPLYPFYAGVYGVGCGLGRDNYLLARHLFFSSFRLFLWIFVDVDASAIKLIMI